MDKVTHGSGVRDTKERRRKRIERKKRDQREPEKIRTKKPYNRKEIKDAYY